MKREKKNDACAICRAADKPGFVGFELGFVAGAKAMARDEVREFVAGLCEPHAKSFAVILANRVKR